MQLGGSSARTGSPSRTFSEHGPSPTKYGTWGPARERVPGLGGAFGGLPARRALCRCDRRRRAGCCKSLGGMVQDATSSPHSHSPLDATGRYPTSPVPSPYPCRRRASSPTSSRRARAWAAARPAPSTTTPSAVYSAGCTFPPTHRLRGQAAPSPSAGLGVQLAVPPGAVAPRCCRGARPGPRARWPSQSREVSASSLLQAPLLPRRTRAGERPLCERQQQQRLAPHRDDRATASAPPARPSLRPWWCACRSDLTEVAAYGWGLSGESGRGGGSSRPSRSLGSGLHRERVRRGRHRTGRSRRRPPSTRPPASSAAPSGTSPVRAAVHSCA